ncbi:MAG: hypothetical protein H0V44_08575 [Planctomycetes bacterium]|nr:hypothetical protein [Planctomycetota bacterium]
MIGAESTHVVLPTPHPPAEKPTEEVIRALSHQMRVSPTQVSQVITGLYAGMKIGDAARLSHVPYQKMKKIVVAIGWATTWRRRFTTRSRRWRISEDEVLRRARDGASYRQLSDLTGITKQAIAYYLKSQGFPRRALTPAESAARKLQKAERIREARQSAQSKRTAAKRERLASTLVRARAWYAEGATYATIAARYGIKRMQLTSMIVAARMLLGEEWFPRRKIVRAVARPHLRKVMRPVKKLYAKGLTIPEIAQKLQWSENRTRVSFTASEASARKPGFSHGGIPRIARISGDPPLTAIIRWRPSAWSHLNSRLPPHRAQILVNRRHDALHAIEVELSTVHEACPIRKGEDDKSGGTGPIGDASTFIGVDNFLPNELADVFHVGGFKWSVLSRIALDCTRDESVDVRLAHVVCWPGHDRFRKSGHQLQTTCLPVIERTHGASIDRRYG